MSKENITFSGDGSGLNFNKFDKLIQALHGENMTKADILRKLKGDALDFAATLVPDLTTRELLEKLRETYTNGERDELAELKSLGGVRFNTLETLIGKFLSRIANPELKLNEICKTKLFISVIGMELGYEVNRNNPRTLRRAIEDARVIENGSIRLKGRSLYTGQFVAKTLQNFDNQPYMALGYGVITPQEFVQKETPLELKQPIIPVNQNQQEIPQSSPYKQLQNQEFFISKFCKYCKKKGHTIQECWSKNKKKVHHQNKQSTDAITVVNEERNEMVNRIERNNLSAVLEVNGRKVKGLIDSGSSLTFMWKSLAEKLKLQIESKQTTVNYVSNDVIKIIGTTKTTIKLGEVSAEITVNIVEDNKLTIDCLYGIDTITALQLTINIMDMVAINEKFKCGTKLFFSKEHNMINMED
ncbi:hypothetical protein ACTA71_006214 [Dictyostelium dimigraforme]